MTGEVVAATSSASFKLIFICVAVGWLLKTDRLPQETAPVLTQVNSALVSHLRTCSPYPPPPPPTQRVSPKGQAGGPVGLHF